MQNGHQEDEIALINPSRDSQGDQQEKSKENQQLASKSSEFSAGINLFKGFVGLGVLAMPQAAHYAGLAISPIAIIFASLSTYYFARWTIDIQINLKLDVRNLTDFINKMLGRNWAIATAIFVTISQFGVGVGYANFFMKFFTQAFCNFRVESMCENKLYDFLISLAIVIPLSFLPGIANLVVFTFIANVLIVFSLLVIQARGIELMVIEGVKSEYLLVWQGIASLFATTLFAQECTSFCFEIKDSMQNSSKFGNMLRNQFIISTILYILVVVLCDLGFGNNVKDMVIFNLPFERITSILVQLAYAVVLCISFPLQLFPIFILLENTLFHYGRSWGTWGIRICARILLAAGISGLALIIPNLSLFISLIGGLSGAQISQFIPFVSIYKYLDLRKLKISVWEHIWNYGIMILGIIGGILSIYFSIVKLSEL